MRKKIFGVLALLIGALYLVFALRPAVGESVSLLQIGFGAILLFGGIELLLRRGEQSRTAARLEGVAALGLAIGVVAKYAIDSHGSGAYATGQLSGVILFTLLFGGFGLSRLLR